MDHWEAIQIWYDGSIDTFKKLIEIFLNDYKIDTMKIWYQNKQQKECILKVNETIKVKNIENKISRLSNFYLAEQRHQKHNVAKLRNNPKSWDFTTLDI